MALLASGFFTPLLFPPPPEPPPPFVFLPDLRVVCSSCYPPDLPVPPDPPDLLPSLGRFFSSVSPATPLSACSVNLLSLAICCPESLNDSSTAVCRFCSGCYPAPSSSNMVDFGTTNYLPTDSRICGCSLVVLGIRSEILFDWVCEALFPVFDSITGFLVAQRFITHLLCCLTSSLSHKEDEVLVMFDLESHVSVFMVIVNSLVALVGYLMEFLFALNFSLSLSDSCVWSFVLMIASRFSSSFKNMYLDAQDFPALQGLSSWYYDFPAIIAECLALLDAQVAAILLSIFKLAQVGVENSLSLLRRVGLVMFFGSY
ncbi:hypothetical protein Bca52824_080028 [Brassica carinata]|uniref:PI-PLC Y-box domain-containing protein n=1 Tax=Brassica carinata TaxID=52824 RepID=A0A8X7PYJ0_BRACI|nr:hypothetical protein Bca52824_080028 [Brassica carinata]